MHISEDFMTAPWAENSSGKGELDPPPTEYRERPSNTVHETSIIYPDGVGGKSTLPELSERGVRWSSVEFLHGKEDSFDPVTNPNGIVRLDNSENTPELCQCTIWEFDQMALKLCKDLITFMHEDLAKFINDHNNFGPEHLAYGEGYTGTLRLRTAMANHLNEYFRPFQTLDPESITFTAGVTELNEVCSMVTCDHGEWIMVGRLVYGTFDKDLNMRTGVNVLRAPVGDTDQFSPNCVAGYEQAFEEAKVRGQHVRALVICNPNNPLGRCYPPETLEAILRFCAVKKIHLISDEIYALSVYERNDRPSETFTSVLSIDSTNIIDPQQIHVLYGLSKDYGAAGMRLGCVLSQNRQFSASVRSVCRFSSPSQFSMDLAAKFLEDRLFVRHFLESSHRRLLQSRLHTETLLQQNNIQYHDQGNAGLFVWLELSPYLELIKSGGDGWAAEKQLSDMFEEAGVLVDSGKAYSASQPGGFRLVHTVRESTVTEGISRISAVLSRLGGNTLTTS